MRVLIVRLAFAAFVAGGVVTCALNAQQPATPELTAQDLRDGLKNPTRWLTYSGNYANHRHSPLTQITPENVHRLTAQWQFQTDTLGKFEAAPLVFDGVIYVTGPLDTGWAIDARSGRQIWRYRRDLPGGLIACCGLVNRGFGILGDRLFKTTLDAHVVAISRKTGALEWDTAMATVPERLQRDDRAARGQRQGARRRRRRRVRRPRLHRCLRCAERQAGLAVLHDRRPGRSGPRDVARYRRQGVGARRRIDLGDWRVRSGAQSRLLGHRQRRAGLQRRGARRRQPLHRVDRRARRRHRQAALALSVHAARHLGLGLDADAGAGRPHDRRRSRARSCCSRTATASSTCSIARPAN